MLKEDSAIFLSPDFKLTQASPIAWLQLLSHSLLKTQVRLKGKAISLEEGFEEFFKLLTKIREHEQRLWWVGNGGSAALCSHLSQDAMNKLNLKSQTLNDPALLTCVANDFGYSEVFARPLSTLAESGDLLIGISSSGKSQNIIKALELAEMKGMPRISFTAFSSTNPVFEMPSDLAFYLPADLYGIAEVGHEALIHSALESLWLREQSQLKNPQNFS